MFALRESTAVEEAIGRVHDQRSFVQELLVDALGWPIDRAAASIEEVAYEWTDEELRIEHLDQSLVGGKAFQIVLPGNPWGIFILEFKKPDVFTSGRGMTGVLRRILRGLTFKNRGRRDSKLAAFSRENLLFISNHNYQRYRFAHFKAPTDPTSSAPMASFGWGPDDVAAIRTICEFNLVSLKWPSARTSPEDWIATWSTAFDVEKVTQQFYADYAQVFADVEARIAETGSLSGDELRFFVQSLFNRLMFLRFVERKGWLTLASQQGTNYLAALADGAISRGQSLYKNRIRPLFFDGLTGNGPTQADSYGSVAILNGGLFEESALDKKVRDIPDEALGRVIGQEGLFYRYNFTVEESTPLNVEVAVDPEMLGKVFEELVTGRHRSGSYYTPRGVVSFMCRAGIRGYLAATTSADSEAIRKLVDLHVIDGLTERHAAEIIQALERIRAVDPACGSGAYLLGMLHELIAIRRALQSDRLQADPEFLYGLKLQIISNNLYGVDIDSFATEITKLRLWLSLAVEAERPVPLPNLDFKIETGDSLLGPDPQQVPDLFRSRIHDLAKSLASLKAKHLLSQGPAKPELRKAIQSFEAQVARELHAHVGKTEIDWRIKFAEVFDEGGFDVVLANPPYVRKEEIPLSIKPILEDRFGEAITGRSDLYCSFYMRGVQLLRDGGMHVFVCSSAWLDAGYGARLQEYLLRTCHVMSIYDSALEKQFSTANVNTVITVLRKGRAEEQSLTHFVLFNGPFGTLDECATTRETIVRQSLLRSRGSTGRLYTGDKWGGKYLRAPDIYSRIATDTANGLVRLSQIAEVSGYIHDNNTRGHFAKASVIWSVKDALNIRIVKSSEGVQTIGVSSTGNSRDWAPLLFPRTCGARHLVVWCGEGVLGKEFYKINPTTSRIVASLAAQLNSTLAILQREILGIKSLGGGALKFAAADVEQFLVVPDLDIGPAADAWTNMTSRKVLDIHTELTMSDRRTIDLLLLRRLGLGEDALDELYEVTSALVEARVTKARSA